MKQKSRDQEIQLELRFRLSLRCDRPRMGTILKWLAAILVPIIAKVAIHLLHFG